MESSVGRGAIILRKGLGLDDIRLTTLIRIVCELNSSQPVAVFKTVVCLTFGAKGYLKQTPIFPLGGPKTDQKYTLKWT